ncbi:MAG: DUF427 domain-containing protein [Bacteroidota bacterium]|nr:DUF427 domain-containing protein [Candidatus Kapabacteria bacterium]MDW8219125.1 DUF427 domain-containing protein [Bacteroidota bacterium]
MAAPVIITPNVGQESVWDYPRPPRVEPFHGLIRVRFGGVLIAETRRAQRVLEKSHPPTYYISMHDIAAKYLKKADGESYCEWKGIAKYFSLVVDNKIAERAAWYYPNPTPEFAVLKNHVAFYASAVDECTVNGEQVRPQPGGFYGGWITSNIVGPFKGEPGTEDW